MGTDRRATQSSENYYQRARGPRTHPVRSRWLRWSRAHGSTIPVWRPTPSGTNFPSGQTQRDPDVCASLGPPGTARHRHSCLHTVEAEPNSGFLRSLVHTAPTPHEHLLQQLGLCFAKAFAIHIRNSHQKLMGGDTHIHTHIPIIMPPSYHGYVLSS